LAEIFDTVIDDRQVEDNGRTRTEAGIAKLIHRTRDHVIHQATDGGAGIASHGSRNMAKDVDIVLLAGGLGQSSYLKDKVKMSFTNKQDSNAFQPLVRALEEPQLCVCKGLLENKLFEMFRARKCNANYGVLQDKALKLWKPMHLVAKVANQCRDIGGKRYMQRVEWLVEMVRGFGDKRKQASNVR
jgi:hypothetical protein